MTLAYVAFDKTGREVRGTVDARDPNEATESLRRKGLYVTRIGDRGSGGASADGGAGRAQFRWGKAKRMKNLAVFARQLYVLISSGTRLVEAMAALERQTDDEKWKAVISDIRRDVEEGASLSEAVEAHPEYFDAVLRSMIAAGETGGNLVQMLDRMATLLQKRVQVTKTIRGAMVYPVLLIVLALGVLSVLLTFVVPRFASLFESLDVPLPESTQVLIVVSDAFRAYWWAGIGLAVGLVALVHFWGTSASGQRIIHRAMVRLPQVGPITRSFATARTLRLLGVLLDSQVPLLEALQLTREGTGNLCYADLIGRAEEAVTRGEPVSTAFDEPTLIAPSVYQAIRSGEESGQVAPLLLNLAQFMDEENEVVLRSLTSIIEPVILIFLGLVVGVVALSMFTPLFDMTTMAGGG